MANIPELISKLATGDGVYKGDAVFALADGSFIDADKNSIAPASAIGAAAYAVHPGYAPNANPTATVRGGVLAAAKGVGDTVPCKIGTDGKLYVAAYPADQYEMAGFVVEVDEVAAALPELPVEHNDGYKLADKATKKIYTLATVEESQTWGSGVSIAAGKLYTDGTDLYVFGSGSLAKI